MNVYEESAVGSLVSAEQTYTYLSVNTDSHQIEVRTTKNSEYPSTPQAIYNNLGVPYSSTDQLTKYTKQFYLHAAVNLSGWKQEPLFQEIPFWIEYELNCKKGFVTISNNM